MEEPQKEKWISFKGCELGRYFYPKWNMYIFYTAETVGDERTETQYSGEYAALEAKTAFMNAVESRFGRWFKKQFAENGYDPVIGTRVKQ